MALVVGYHLAPSVLPGGFLGVDIFFVLSGFLITSLRHHRGAAAGRLRGRCVLPATDPAAAARAAPGAAARRSRCTRGAGPGPGELDRLRAHSLWTLGYLANWRFIADGTTYTDVLYGQSPLRHTWSLAIEEQFYIVFPLARAGLGDAACGGEPRRFAGRSAPSPIVGRAAPARPGWPCCGATARTHPAATSAPTPACTRCSWACCSASCWSAGPCESEPPGPVGRGRARSSARVGLAAAAIAEPRGLRRSSSTAASSASRVATAAVIAGSERVSAVAVGAHPAGRSMGLGLISYGVYLWHWPVIIVLDEARTGLERHSRSRTLRISRHPRHRHWPATSSSSCPIRRGRLRDRARNHARCALSAASVGTVAAVVLAATVVPAPTVLPPRPTDVGRRPEVAAAHDLPIGVVMFGDSVARSLAGAERRLRATGDPSSRRSIRRLVRLWNVARDLLLVPGGQRDRLLTAQPPRRTTCCAARGRGRCSTTPLAADDYDVVLARPGQRRRPDA